jgi:hypothetical protein
MVRTLTADHQGPAYQLRRAGAGRAAGGADAVFRRGSQRLRDPAAAPSSWAQPVDEGRRRAQVQRLWRQYLVVYEAEPDEPLEDAPVACPHCWQVGKVQIARSASIGRDYRADKI